MGDEQAERAGAWGVPRTWLDQPGALRRDDIWYGKALTISITDADTKAREEPWSRALGMGELDLMFKHLKLT